MERDNAPPDIERALTHGRRRAADLLDTLLTEATNLDGRDFSCHLRELQELHKRSLHRLGLVQAMLPPRDRAMSPPEYRCCLSDENGMAPCGGLHGQTTHWESSRRATSPRDRQLGGTKQHLRRESQSDDSAVENSRHEPIDKVADFDLTPLTERLSRMWDGFSVTSYTPHMMAPLVEDTTIVCYGAQELQKHVPWVTKPEPFRMTIREEKRRQQASGTRSALSLERDLREKQQREEEACQKVFRAAQLPTNTHLPLFDNMSQQHVQRRCCSWRVIKENTAAVTKPISHVYLKYHDFQQEKPRHRQLEHHPLPSNIISSTADEHTKDKELPQAQHFLRVPALPRRVPRRQVCKQVVKDLQSKQKDGFQGSRRPRSQGNAVPAVTNPCRRQRSEFECSLDLKVRSL
uniref:protein FAM161A-like n=1 Tax=Myxine glutinosa TaxID=7769 RepID=UPI00358EE359